MMPGDWVSEEIPAIAEHVPTVDTKEWIEEWRSHPLVPLTKPKEDQQVQTRVVYRIGDELEGGAGGGGEQQSQWSLQRPPEFVDHGHYMMMRPGE